MTRVEESRAQPAASEAPGRIGLERAVYFDAWFPRQHCYHPSLPPRRLRMIDDLADFHATMLVWSALGGGSISLPYLESEAFGRVDSRFRFYGFVNDSEFIAAARARDIKVFGIVFEVQGWEFPVELSEGEDEILAINELRGNGEMGWMGLREFSRNRYPKLWGSFESYFPGGLVNSDGDPVEDLLEECCSRDIYGEPCHAHWVEAPDHDHYCYTMDRNNPVWREYLKAVIRIQIDAGVDGIQLDEAELPLTSLQYGGCFCKDCMKGFRDHLIKRSDLVADIVPRSELDEFHYGRWLLDKGYDFKDDQSSAPLYIEYLRFQREAIVEYFLELADYAREYGRAKGREVLVSGNFFNLQDHYFPMEPSVDVIVTEMRNTTYRQPEWYRYAAGFAEDKPVVVVENPYGGVIPELASELRVGRGADHFRMSLYEAAAMGASMSVPYGAWMGSVIEESFWPPHELCTEIQDWLARHDALFSSESAATVGVVFSVESNFVLEAHDRPRPDNTINAVGENKLPFWVVCERLSRALQPYDVVFFPEGTLRVDELTVEDLVRYRTLVLPHCHVLTERQAQLLAAYLDAGGHVVALGPLGANLKRRQRSIVETHPHTDHLEVRNPSVTSIVSEPQIEVDGSLDGALHLQRVADGVAVHLIRYDYDDTAGEVPLLGELTLKIALDETFGSVEGFGAPAPPEVDLTRQGPVHELRLRNVPLYSIVLLGLAAESSS
jgi:hypothetical protein